MQILIVYSLPDCSDSHEACLLGLKEGFKVIEKSALSLSIKEWRQKIGKVPASTPVIFLGKNYLGSYKELKLYIEAKKGKPSEN